MYDTPTNLVILIPAAGAARRMRGRDKLLEMVDGVPLIARQTTMALATGKSVLVTLPPNSDTRRAALGTVAGQNLTVSEVPNASEGIAASLRAGAAFAQAHKAEALMVVLADMPELQAADLNKSIQVFSKHKDKVIQSTDCDGQHGHPVILPKHLFHQLLGLQGDEGAKTILKAHDVQTVPLPGHHATTDLDTPESWHEWRKKSGR